MFLGVPKNMLVRLGWVAASFGAVQVLRLLNNVILTRLLEPAIFGIMALVVAIRVGIELVSDVGITQNVVSNPQGDQPDFYDTAWTLQVLRNLVLAIICLILAGPFARFFDHPELRIILSVASIFFLFSGFDSTARGIVRKRLQVARIAIFDIALAIITFIAHVGAALIIPNVWAVMIGMVITSSSVLIISFLYVPGLRHRLIYDPQSARHIFRFGKWVLFSSVVYFFAMNFDRLYFAKQITLSQLGVYGIARTLAEMISQLVLRASSFVLFPSVAAAALSGPELRQRLIRGRRTLLLGAAVAMGVLLASSDLLVAVLYDPRYSEAGVILPILCVGVWFGILTSTNDSILMGLSKPAYPAFSNAAKLIAYATGVPIAFHFFGFLGAVAVIAAGEVVKYLALWMFSRREHLHFGRDDFALTIAFVITAFVTRGAVLALGWNGGTQAAPFGSLLRTLI